MNADFRRVKEVFLAAVEQAEGPAREDYLREACGADEELRRRVEALLGCHAQADRFLEDATAGADAGPVGEAPGAEIGPYRLLEPIGEGGFGVVYLAEQQVPVRRQVALKIVKPGMDSRDVIARFQAERQALAIMDHPNIARVFDGGATPSGRPYFVMELVRGTPITDYCDGQHLSVRDRLGLFAEVCRAVQHAHQKGIIHRDLKPSNVLVALYDDRSVVKVIDFGVAKAIGQRLTDATPCTAFGALVGTPEYMSPEQAETSNHDIDTRSDIYSLGVLLYELLTGSTPLTKKRARGAALLEILRVIREEEPPRPSTRLSSADELPSISAQRHTEPAMLTRLVRGELDWIAMKALEKDRGRRYDTANSFAMDVQRYLADEPVQACPPSLVYRLRKFARRNRGAVVAAGLVAAALLAGVVGTTVGMVRAERRAEGERLAKDSAEKRLAQIERGIGILGSIFANLDPMAEEKEGRPLRAILGDRLDLAAAELEGDAVGDPLVVARLQDRLGQTYLGLGQGVRAEALFAKAVATREAQLGADDPLMLGSKHNLALALVAAGKRSEAVELFEGVWIARATVLGPDHLDTLTTLNDLAVEYWNSGRLAEAVPLLEQVREGRVRKLGEDHDDTLATLGRLAGAYLSAGRRAEAVALAETVWHARVKKNGDDHPQAIAAMANLAFIYQGAYKMKPALALYEQARDKIVPRLGPYHPLTFEILRNLGHMHWVYGRTSEAIPLLEEVRQRQLMVLGGQHPKTLPTLWDLAGAYRAAGDLTKALSLYQQAAAGVERLQFEHSYADHILGSLALCHEALKQFDEAIAWRRKCMTVVERKFGKESVNYAEELIRIGSDQLCQKNPADAEPGLRQALAILDKRPNAGEKLYAQSLLGAALVDQQRYADAEPLLLEAYRGMTNFTTEHPGEGTLPWRRRVDALRRLVQLYEATNRPDKAAAGRKELAAIDHAPGPTGKPKGQ